MPSTKTSSRTEKRKEQRDREAKGSLPPGHPRASYVSPKLDYEDHPGGMTEPEEKWYGEFDKQREEEEEAAEENDQKVIEEEEKAREEREKEAEKEAKAREKAGLPPAGYTAPVVTGTTAAQSGSGSKK
jgi:hypothetical protein